MALRFRGGGQKKATGAPVPIKRVIRRDGHFICGVCRRARASEGEAEACLESCLAQWLKSAPPVNEVKDGDAKQFRCGFCKRVYGKRQEAQSCADACRSKTKQAVESERSVSPTRATAAAATARAPSAAATARAPSAAAAPTPVEDRKFKSQAPKFGREHMHKFLRDGRKLVCRKCGKESPTMETVIACYDAHVAPPKAEKAAKAPPPEKVAKAPKAPAPAPVVAAAPAPPPPAEAKVDDAAMFFRDGARYVCRKCSAKFFTRGDVVACYAAHAAAGSVPA